MHFFYAEGFTQKTVQFKIAVLIVAGNRRFLPRKMNAYLVHAPCAERQINERKTKPHSARFNISLPSQAKKGFGFFCVPLMHDRVVDAPLVRGERSGTQSTVSFGYEMRTYKLCPHGRRCGIFCRYQKPRSVLIQAVHKIGFGAPLFGKQGIHRRTYPETALYRKTRRLVYDANIIVFEYNGNFHLCFHNRIFTALSEVLLCFPIVFSSVSFYNLCMNYKRAKQRAFFFIYTLLLAAGIRSLSAEQMYSPTWGYVLDIPEGFRLGYKEGTDSYQFEHKLFPVTLIVRSWPQTIPAGKKMKEVLAKLNASGETKEIVWLSRNCALSSFSMQLQNRANRGWAVIVPADKDKGLTLVLAYTPEQQFGALQTLIVSSLNSFSPQSNNRNISGILTDYGYPKTGPRQTSVKIGKTEVPVELDKSDSEAHNALIDIEYDVLARFADTPLWKEAWQRYYRMIYRDAYKRLEKTAFSVYNVLEAELKTKLKAGADFDKKLAQTLLSWVQLFPYERRRNASDFTGLIDTLTGTGSDCDSRSLLLAVLMAHMKYKTMLFISPQYSHALFGIDIESAGAHLEQDGTNYLLGETTAHVGIGLVAQQMSDLTKWFGIAGLGK